MRFQSASKYYVNWGMPKGFESKVDSDYTFICNLKKSEFDYLLNEGIVLDYRILEYFEVDFRVTRYNVVVSGYHDGI
jgi:hypothetical protein